MVQISSAKTVLPPFTEQVLPIHGFDNKCFSLRGRSGGAGCIIKLEGINYTDATASSLHALQESIAQALQQVSITAGQTNDGVGVRFTIYQHRLDTTDIAESLRSASERVNEPGLAGVAWLESQHFKRLEQQGGSGSGSASKTKTSQGLVEREYYITLVLTEKAFKIEQLMADQELELDEMLKLREQLDEDEGSALESQTMARLEGNLWQKLRHNIRQGWDELQADSGDSNKNNGLTSDFELGGSIQNHPVTIPLAEAVIRKAEQIIAALQPHGLNPRLLSNKEAARETARMLGMPAALTLFTSSSSSPITAPAAAAAAPTNNGTARGGAGAELGSLLVGGIDDSDLADQPIDVSQLGHTSFEFDSRYVKVAANPQKGTLRPSYFTTLYATQWPKEIRLGQYINLITQPDLDFLATIHITPVPPNKAQKGLERQLSNLEMFDGLDQSGRAKREQRNQAWEIEDMLEQYAAGLGSLMRVTMRLAVISHTPTRLKSAARTIQSKLSNARFTFHEANFNQAFGLFSVLPCGRDYLASAAGYGKETIRVMSSQAAAALFPALIHEEADPDGIHLGSNDTGGITRLNLKKLPVKHITLFGMSGYGKTVSKQGWFCRLLISDPKLKVRMVDLQDMTYEPVLKLGGEAVKVGSDGQFRINMLDRSAMGKPTLLPDMIDSIASFLILMRRSSLTIHEDTHLQNCLLRLYMQFEQGDSLLDLVMRGLANQYHEPLGFSEPGHYALLYNFLQELYPRLQIEFRIPTVGYIVSPVLHPVTERLIVYNPVTDEFVADYDSPQFLEREKSNSRLGIRLRIWHTQPDHLARNVYSGGGYDDLEIPFAAYKLLSDKIQEQKYQEFQKDAMLAYFLLCYLAEANPRRIPLRNDYDRDDHDDQRSQNEKGHARDINVNNNKGQWQSPPTEEPARHTSGLLGANLSPKGGAFFYADEHWWSQVEAKFKFELSNLGYIRRKGVMSKSSSSQTLVHQTESGTGSGSEEGKPVNFWAKVDSWDYALILRNCLLPLKRGVPILGDLISLLYYNPESMALASGLEPFANKNLSGPLYDGHTNVDINNRLFSFCLKNVSDKQRGLRIMQCIEILWKQIANQPPDETTVLFWDEYGSLVMLMPELADYVQMLFKRARAFNAIIILAEQSYELARTNAGKKAVDNAGIIELMHQSDTAAEQAGLDLNLTRKEIEWLKQAKPGQSLLIISEGGRKHKMMANYDLPPRLLKILSTKPEDRAEREREKRSQQRGGGRLLPSAQQHVHPLTDLMLKYGGKEFLD